MNILIRHIFKSLNIFFHYIDFFILDSFHKQLVEIDLTLACVGELNTTIRGGIPWPIIYGIGLNIKTGDIFPATFPDKGPDFSLRMSRYLTGYAQVFKITFMAAKLQLNYSMILIN